MSKWTCLTFRIHQKWNKCEHIINLTVATWYSRTETIRGAHTRTQLCICRPLCIYIIWSNANLVARSPGPESCSGTTWHLPTLMIHWALLLLGWHNSEINLSSGHSDGHRPWSGWPLVPPLIGSAGCWTKLHEHPFLYACSIHIRNIDTWSCTT